MTAASDDSGHVDLVRTLPHYQEDVFATLVDASAVAEWMCPDPDVRVETLQWNPAPGAPYEIVMRVGEHRVTFSGTFQEVSPPRRLVFTWAGERTEGHETRVTIELSARPDGTDLRLVHEELPTPEALHDHAVGWQHILQHLTAFLDNRGR